MRRPLVGIAFSFIAGICIGYILNLKIFESIGGYAKVLSIGAIVLATSVFIYKILVTLCLWKQKGSSLNKSNNRKNHAKSRTDSKITANHFAESDEHDNLWGNSIFGNVKKYIITIIVFFLLGCTFYLLSNERLTIYQDDLDGILNSKVTLIGEVENLEIKEYENATRCQFTLDILESSSETKFIKGKVLVTTYSKIVNPETLVGRKVRVTGDIKIPSGKRNPNSFNYRLYLKTEGISAIFEVDGSKNISVIDKKGGFRGYLFEKKFEFLTMLEEKIGPEEAGIIRALIFGDKSGIDEESLMKFQNNGVIHILAVSGLHISMIYGFCVLIFGSVRKKSTCIVIFVVLLSYGFLADFTPSVMRAMVMIGTHVFASIRFHRYDMLTATGFSALVLLILNPLDLFSLGFQLSFGATTLLSLFIELSKRREKGRWIDNMMPVILLQVFMIPFTAYTFNYVSIISIFANIPIVFIASIGVPLGMSCFIASLLGETLFVILSAPIKVVGRIMIELNELFYVENITSISLVSPPLWFVILFYLMTFIIFCEWGLIRRMRKEYMQLAILSLGIFCISLSVGNLLADNYKNIKYVFVDVGQGDCIHIKSPTGKNILVDGGGSFNYDVGRKTVMPYLLKNGVNEIDLAIVSHLDTDHVGGIISLAEEGLIKQVAVYSGVDKENENYKKLKENTNVIYLTEGDSVDIDKGLNIDILGPAREKIGENENNNSLITMFEYEGERLLLPGDIDEEVEKDLASNYDLNSHILKITHHGSKTGTSEVFVEAVNPQIAVIQVGENGYGHPADRVIELCRKKGIIVYRNDENGAIRFYDNGEVLITNGILQ